MLKFIFGLSLATACMLLEVVCSYAQSVRMIETIGDWDLIYDNDAKISPFFINVAPDDRLVRTYCIAESLGLPIQELGVSPQERDRAIKLAEGPNYACLILACNSHPNSGRGIILGLFANATPIQEDGSSSPGATTLSWRLLPGSPEKRIFTNAKPGTVSADGRLLKYNSELDDFAQPVYRQLRLYIHAPVSLMDEWAGKVSMEMKARVRQNASFPPDFTAQAVVSFKLRRLQDAAKRFEVLCSTYLSKRR